MQGNRNPKMKKNFLGDLPSFLYGSVTKVGGKEVSQSYLRMVQEKVALSRPNVPHTSTRGGRIIPKENIQTPNIMRMMLVLL